MVFLFVSNIREHFVVGEKEVSNSLFSRYPIYFRMTISNVYEVIHVGRHGVLLLVAVKP